MRRREGFALCGALRGLRNGIRWRLARDTTGEQGSVGGGRYDGGMADEVHVTLSGGLRGRYVLERKLTGGRVVLAPETSAEAILARLGHEPATLAEFEAEHGPVRPADGP